jgi:hypothetical protein
MPDFDYALPGLGYSSSDDIDQSVGRDCKNLQADVRTVQRLINAKLPIPRLPLQVNGIFDWTLIRAIEAYQRSNWPILDITGKIEPDDATLRSLKNTTVPAKPKTGKYTDSPYEVPRKQTKPTPREVVDMVLAAWPDAQLEGARVLAAQFMLETTGGANCYNWNLGNVKAGASEPHYYGPTWECRSQSDANADVANGKGLARIPSEDEVKQLGNKYGMTCSSVMVLYGPPHTMGRFRAYPSLPIGAERWVNHHQTVARMYPNYLKTLKDGDAATAAKILGQAKYYTADPVTYAHGMTSQKKIIDAALGLNPAKWKSNGSFPVPINR